MYFLGLGSVINITISGLGKQTVFMYSVNVYFFHVSMVGMADISRIFKLYFCIFVYFSHVSEYGRYG